MLLHGLSITYRSLMKTNGKLAKSQWKEIPWVVCYEVLVQSCHERTVGIEQDWCLVAQWVQYDCIHRLLSLGLSCTGFCICSAVC